MIRVPSDSLWQYIVGVDVALSSSPPDQQPNCEYCHMRIDAQTTSATAILACGMHVMHTDCVHASCARLHQRTGTWHRDSRRHHSAADLPDRHGTAENLGFVECPTCSKRQPRHGSSSSRAVESSRKRDRKKHQLPASSSSSSSSLSSQHQQQQPLSNASSSSVHRKRGEKRSSNKDKHSRKVSATLPEPVPLAVTPTRPTSSAIAIVPSSNALLSEDNSSAAEANQLSSCAAVLSSSSQVPSATSSCPGEESVAVGAAGHAEDEEALVSTDVDDDGAVVEIGLDDH